MDIAINGLLIAYVTFTIAIVSPGPANMLIATTAVHGGRTAAICVAAGVVSGSALWGALTSTGLSALLVAKPSLLLAIKLAGGVYLLFLAYRITRSLLVAPSAKAQRQRDATSFKHDFLLGLGVHLTNPKAPLAWIGIIALALDGSVSPFAGFIVVLGTTVIACIVYGGIAILFSDSRIASWYSRFGRRIDSVTALIFCVSGLSLVFSFLGS
jgi:threonine efflux protein